MVSLMKYCISISVYIFCCMKITEKKLIKITIIETNFRLYEQTPRHVLMEENSTSYQAGEYSTLSGIEKTCCCFSIFISTSYQCAMHTVLSLV